MMPQSTSFFRLLAADDKPATLRAAIQAFAAPAATPTPDAYTLDPASFRQIPGSPFAYWVSGRLRSVFSRLPPFEEDTRAVRQGGVNGDDFRYLRTLWELPVRSASASNSAWLPFAKGGEYGAYYWDLPLMANWDTHRYTFYGFTGLPHRPNEKPASADYYFRPGLTYPRRTQGGFSVRAMPAGCIFADKGPAMFVAENGERDLLALLAIVNSAPFRALLSLQMAFGSYEVGVVQRTPVPRLSADDAQALATLAREAHDLKRDADRDDEVTHPFTAPALARLRATSTLREALLVLGLEATSREQRFANIQRMIDDHCFALYGFSDEDRAQVEGVHGALAASDGVDEQATASEDEEAAAANDEEEAEEAESETGAQASGARNTADLLMYAVGCAFGRWDVRIGHDPSLAPKLAEPFAPLPVCAPGALVGSDGLPASEQRIASEAWLGARPDAITLPPAESVQRPTITDDQYPIRIAWDGLLVDDPEHPADIVGRVREALAVLWPGEGGARAEAIERDACQILGVRELRDYFRKPTGFFEDHLKRYSKSRRQAPIYWPLSTVSGSYTLWVYYHRLTSDTLYTAVNRYVEPKLAEVRRRLADDERALADGASGREASRLRASVEQGQMFQRELQAFRDELVRVAALPYQPNLNDGAIITAAPLHRLFRLPRWARDTKAAWQKLERGDYDWAHLAYTLWPDRVREKCRADKSLAIAHGLEALYVEPPTTAKKARGRKAAAEEELFEVENEE